MKRKRIMGIALAVAVILAAMIVVPVQLSRRRPQLGLDASRLRPCPDSPNCVNSLASDEDHAIEPLEGGADPLATFDRLRDLLESSPRVRVVTDRERYLHAEYTTPLLRFVDDVEFLLDEDASVIHVRSASRVGRSDLGANRQRIEELRQKLVES